MQPPFQPYDTALKALSLSLAVAVCSDNSLAHPERHTECPGPWRRRQITRTPRRPSAPIATCPKWAPGLFISQPSCVSAAFSKAGVLFLEALVPRYPKCVTQGPHADSPMLCYIERNNAGDCQGLSKESQMACPLLARKQNVGRLNVTYEVWIGTTHHYGLAMTSKSSTTERQERLRLACVSHQDD